MENLKERLVVSKKALLRFIESLDRLEVITDESERSFYRDSVIQRFEFTYEVFWKFLRTYLVQGLKVDAAQLSNARMTFREALNEKLLSPKEFDDCLLMLEDRNQTSHTYEEDYANELAGRARLYATLIKAILERISL